MNPLWTYIPTDPRKKRWLIYGLSALAVVIILAIVIPLSIPATSAPLKIAGSSVLTQVPLIDGHNDLPFNLYSLRRNQLDNFTFEQEILTDPSWGLNRNHTHTDLPHLRRGRVGGQFWVAYTDCKITQDKDAVERALEQIDVIKRLARKYPNDLELVTTADGERQGCTG